MSSSSESTSSGSSGSTSSGSSGNKRSNGGNWTYRVKYCSDCGTSCPKPQMRIIYPIPSLWLIENRDKEYVFLIDHDVLVDAMSLLIDCSERISNIWVFKSPLWFFQLSQVYFNHQFVVIETDNWWWSIEKNDQEILIQRSKTMERVRDYENGKKRKTPLRKVSSDEGRKTMGDLIEFLHNGNHLRKKYALQDQNCQYFAEEVFNRFAKSKYHNRTFGSDLSGNDTNMSVDSRRSERTWLTTVAEGAKRYTFDAILSIFPK